MLFAELLGWAASIAQEMLVPSKLVLPSRQHKQRNNITTEVVYWYVAALYQGKAFSSFLGGNKTPGKCWAHFWRSSALLSW